MTSTARRPVGARFGAALVVFSLLAAGCSSPAAGPFLDAHGSRATGPSASPAAGA